MLPLLPTSVALLGIVLVGPDDVFTKVVEDELRVVGEDVRREATLGDAKAGERVVRIASRELAEHWKKDATGLTLVTITRLTSDDRTDALVLAERARSLSSLAAPPRDAATTEPAASDATPPRLRLFVGMGPTFGTGTPGLLATGGAHLRLHPRVAVSLVGQATVSGQSVSSEAGTTRIREASVGAAVDTPVWSKGVVVDLGVTALASHLASEGVARAPYEGVSDETWTALVGVHAFASVPVTPSFRVGLRPMLAFAPVKTSVRFGGVETATWGSPHVTIPLVVDLTPGAMQ